MDSEELSALLGSATQDIKKQNKKVKRELAELSNGKPLEEKILTTTDDILQRSVCGLKTVLQQVEETPQDVDLVNATSHLITAVNALTGTLSKHYLAERKYEQQRELQNIRLSADIQKNNDNNATRIAMKQEDIKAMIQKTAMETMAKNRIENDKEIIDAEIVEEDSETEDDELDESWEENDEEES